jgi:putative membrane protein
MRKSPFLVSLGAILVSTAALSMAQSNPPASSTPSPQTSPTIGVPQTGAGQASAATQASPPTPRISDQTFVREASAAGLAEVADGQAALKSAKRLDVRKAAQRLVTDHTAANEQLTSLARKKNMPLAAAPAAKPAAPVMGDFDASYIAAQIKAHQDAITLFEAEARTGADNDLRQFAASTLPTLQEHLKMMQSLQ